MNAANFLRAALSRKGTVCACFAAWLGIGAAYIALTPRQYTALASIVIDVKSPDPIVGMAMMNGITNSYLATQVDIIKSERVAKRVVTLLNLGGNRQLREDWLEESNGQGDYEAWIAALIQKKLDVKPSRESNVIEVLYTAQDPKFAAALANAFANASISTNIELRVDPAKRYTTFFEARTLDVKKALEASQERLSRYQQNNGILVSDERLDAENQRLSELTTQLVTAQALASDASNRSVQATRSVDTLQDVINNPVIAGLTADLSRQQAKLEEINQSLGEAHPQVRELRANIAEMQQRLDNESRRIGRSIGVNASINKVRITELTSAIQQQKDKVSQLKKQRDEAAGLIKELENAQRAYDAVSQRLTQSSLESQTSQTNLSILTTASEPNKPSSPKALLTLLASTLLSVLSAFFAVLTLELRDRRIRTVTELASIGCGMVLGTLPNGTKHRNAIHLLSLSEQKPFMPKPRLKG